MHYIVMDLGIFKNFSAIIGNVDVIKKYKRNQIFVRLKGIFSVYICEIDTKFRLVISTKDRQIAYRVLYLIKGYYSIIVPNLSFLGEIQDNPLLEIKKKPRSNWKRNDWLSNINHTVHDYYNDMDLFEIQLNTATGIFDHGEADQLRSLIEHAYSDSKLQEAFNNLRESKHLFNGTMNGSYYYSHFIRERNMLSKQLIEKSYYENKDKYQLAFLASFKAIERMLDVNDIKRKDVKNVLESSGFQFSDPNMVYHRMFEQFNRHEAIITQQKLIEHFLDLRNTVGAHANKNPPYLKRITFDSIFEIQHLITIWIRKYINDMKYVQ